MPQVDYAKLAKQMGGSPVAVEPTPVDYAAIAREVNAAANEKPRVPGLATIGDQVKTKWSDRLGLNEGTASPMVGFMRGAASGAVDLAQGATSTITGQLNAKLRAENEAMDALINELGSSSTGISIPKRPMLPDVEKPENFSGTVGSALPVIGEMAIPGPTVLRTAKAAIPSATRAGKKFQEVMSVARNIPVDVKATGDVALRVMQLAERGATMPIAVRKFLNRVTDPEKGAMVYEEARDFASNISRLSANEFGRLTPAIAREVAELRVALNHAVAQAAKQAGKGEEYASAMKEYAQAMRLRGVVNAAVEGAKKGAPVATAAGVGYWLTQKVRDALGQ